MNNQSKASKSDRYWVMTSEKRSPTYVVYHFDTQPLSPTRVCKKIIFGVFRKNREIPNSMSCTDKKKVLFLESISTLIIKTESEQF